MLHLLPASTCLAQLNFPAEELGSDSQPSRYCRLLLRPWAVIHSLILVQESGYPPMQVVPA